MVNSVLQVADLTALKALSDADVDEGSLVEVADVANGGGLFVAKTTSSVVSQSSVVLRFLPYCFKAQVTVLNGGTAGDTLTIGSKTITLVSGDAGANEVEVQANKNALAVALAKYLNINSVFLGVRARDSVTSSQTFVSLWANTPGSGGAQTVSASGTTFNWAQAFSDPGDQTKLEYGELTTDFFRFVIADASGEKVLIGATPVDTATNFEANVTANSELLDWTCSRSGADVTLTASNTDGLQRLRAIVKGTNGCPVFTVQSRQPAPADTLEAIYIRNTVTSAPNLTFVRKSFLDDNRLMPYNWGVKGDGLDGAEILTKMQAMFDMAHWTDAAVELLPNTVYDIASFAPTNQRPILIQGGLVQGQNSTILNTANIQTGTSPNLKPNLTLNGGVNLGIGHPAYDSQVCFFNIQAADAGDRTITFNSTGDADQFRAGDVVPIATVSGHYISGNWQCASRDFCKLVAKTGASWSIDRPLQTAFPAGSRAELWMGTYDVITGNDLTIADSPIIQDLNVISHNGGAFIRTQIYNANCSFGYVNGVEGLFFNALNGTVRASAVCSDDKAIELAQNSQGASIYVDEIEWRNTNFGGGKPLIKAGEFSRNWVIDVGRLVVGAGFDGDAIISVGEGANGSMRIENSYLSEIAGRKIFLLLNNDDAEEAEVPGDFVNLNVELGLVTYTGQPHTLFHVENDTGSVRDIWLTGGTFVGPQPTNNGALFCSIGGGTSASVAMPGTLRINSPAELGTYRGRFGVPSPGVGGLDSGSTGEGDVVVSRGENTI